MNLFDIAFAPCALGIFFAAAFLVMIRRLVYQLVIYPILKLLKK
ncbi:MAG: hypothetical protein N2117_12740 [Anaerolineales bacterium]|nr:hypothetical protein [Anaerolineales bacterium]